MSAIFFHRTPVWLQKVYPKFSWRKSTPHKELYLTFDDGPIPEATPMILDHLNSYQAKATFFCVGENILRYPEIFNNILEAGHSVGNHTFHHLNGWKTQKNEYLTDIAKCQQLISPYVQRKRPLLRPPYGRIRREQWRPLVDSYEIVMWNVLSGDYSTKVSAERCLNKSIQHSDPGAIVLFHDNIKTIDKLDKVLPAYLEHFKSMDYAFLPL